MLFIDYVIWGDKECIEFLKYFDYSFYDEIYYEYLNGEICLYRYFSVVGKKFGFIIK